MVTIVAKAGATAIPGWLDSTVTSTHGTGNRQNGTGRPDGMKAEISTAQFVENDAGTAYGASRPAGACRSDGVIMEPHNGKGVSVVISVVSVAFAVRLTATKITIGIVIGNRVAWVIDTRWC